jgi:sugar phosphate isomerase/epimerase
MYFGYSTNAFVRFSLEEAIKKIAGLGFNGIEIMCDQPHLYPPDFDDQS